MFTVHLLGGNINIFLQMVQLSVVNKKAAPFGSGFIVRLVKA
jgi:hypothetical protein